MNKKEKSIYKKLKKSFTEIKNWDAGNIKLQDAREAIGEIETEMDTIL
jgi:hypothetical protein